jgi:hypothetical protein
MTRLFAYTGDRYIGSSLEFNGKEKREADFTILILGSFRRIPHYLPTNALIESAGSPVA